MIAQRVESHGDLILLLMAKGRYSPLGQPLVSNQRGGVVTGLKCLVRPLQETAAKFLGVELHGLERGRADQTQCQDRRQAGRQVAEQSEEPESGALWSRPATLDQL